jgi:hypothetical protein
VTSRARRAWIRRRVAAGVTPDAVHHALSAGSAAVGEDELAAMWLYAWHCAPEPAGSRRAEPDRAPVPLHGS